WIVKKRFVKAFVSAFHPNTTWPEGDFEKLLILNTGELLAVDIAAKARAHATRACCIGSRLRLGISSPPMIAVIEWRCPIARAPSTCAGTALSFVVGQHRSLWLALLFTAHRFLVAARNLTGREQNFRKSSEWGVNHLTLRCSHPQE